MILQGLMVFFAQLLTVLLLGFQSKLMRDNRWKLCTVLSLFITLAQAATVHSIANNQIWMPLLLALSGLGGSFGIALSHFAYQYYDKWVTK